MISPVALNHRRRPIRPRAAPPGSALEHGSEEQVTLRIHALLLIFADCSLNAQKCLCACDHRPCASIECSLKMRTYLSVGSFRSALTLASDRLPLHPELPLVRPYVAIADSLTSGVGVEFVNLVRESLLQSIQSKTIDPSILVLFLGNDFADIGEARRSLSESL